MAKKKLGKAQAIHLRALVEHGADNDEIARKLGEDPKSIPALKAILTQGHYDDYFVGDLAIDIEDVHVAATQTFGLELDMQKALRAHIDQFDPHLRIIDGGKERHVETGYIDILAQDDAGSLVVIELKAGDAPESAVTQVLSYIAALRAEEDRDVRGILVAGGFPKKVRFAARACGIQLVTYEFSFTFAVIGDQDRGSRD